MLKCIINHSFFIYQALLYFESCTFHKWNKNCTMQLFSTQQLKIPTNSPQAISPNQHLQFLLCCQVKAHEFEQKQSLSSS